MHLTIIHLYPARMNLYGDRGNVLALVRRAEWRGWTVEVVPVEVGQPADFGRADLIFMGGGEDRHQAAIAEDFRRRRDALLAALSDGVPALAICGAYQLLGAYYETAAGERLDGIGWFAAYTQAGSGRAIGNVVVEAGLDVNPPTLVGFENHGGRTYLEAGQAPLGRVLVGAGNNGRDGTEGAVKLATIGTYLHGSLLPKNPQLADWLLARARERREGTGELEPLDDTLELAAHRGAVMRARRVFRLKTGAGR